MYNAYLDRFVALKCIFSAVIYHSGVYITSACTFSTMHNNIHFCFSLLVTLAFHSYWSRVFHPLQDGPAFSIPAFSTPSKMVPGFPVPRFQLPHLKKCGSADTDAKD